MTQCRACPWRIATRPERDIPNYDPRLAVRLAACTADHLGREMRTMACHETQPGAERPCVGWVANQLGPGNNIMLRLRAITTGEFKDIRLLGKQHETMDDMLASARRAVRRLEQSR